jgi:hypothetical protein
MSKKPLHDVLRDSIDQAIQEQAMELEIAMASELFVLHEHDFEYHALINNLFEALRHPEKDDPSAFVNFARRHSPEDILKLRYGQNKERALKDSALWGLRADYDQLAQELTAAAASCDRSKFYGLALMVHPYALAEAAGWRYIDKQGFRRREAGRLRFYNAKAIQEARTRLMLHRWYGDRPLLATILFGETSVTDAFAILRGDLPSNLLERSRCKCTTFLDCGFAQTVSKLLASKVASAVMESLIRHAGDWAAQHRARDRQSPIAHTSEVHQVFLHNDANSDPSSLVHGAKVASTEPGKANIAVWTSKVMVKMVASFAIDVIDHKTSFKPKDDPRVDFGWQISVEPQRG